LYIIPPVRNVANFDAAALLDGERARSAPKCTGRNGLYKTILIAGFVEAARFLGGQLLLPLNRNGLEEADCSQKSGKRRRENTELRSNVTSRSRFEKE
jgi:hypothetical protein